MDGRVLTEALTVDRPVTYVDVPLPEAGGRTPYSPAEEAVVDARLRALGYREDP
jgi:hypothetical protein